MGTSTDTPATRGYRMTERAESTAATRQAILDAALEIGDPRTPLAAIAERAGVSRRTVLRHFGDRRGLFVACMDEAAERITAQRFAVPAGDVDAAVANLVEHYEEHGDGVVARLAEEGTDARVDAVLANGRDLHRRWVAEKLGPLLGPATGKRSAPARKLRARRIAQLVAVTDVFTWKLLRRDSGLSVRETETAIAELIRAITGGD